MHLGGVAARSGLPRKKQTLVDLARPEFKDKSRNPGEKGNGKCPFVPSAFFFSGLVVVVLVPLPPRILFGFFFPRFLFEVSIPHRLQPPNHIRAGYPHTHWSTHHRRLLLRWCRLLIVQIYIYIYPKKIAEK